MLVRVHHNMSKQDPVSRNGGFNQSHVQELPDLHRCRPVRDQLGCPRRPPSTPIYPHLNSNNGHRSIRIGPWSSGRWPGLVKSLVMWMTGHRSFTYLWNASHRGALWEKKKRGKCSVMLGATFR